MKFLTSLQKRKEQKYYHYKTNAIILRIHYMKYYFYTVENFLCSFDCIKDYITQYCGTKKFPVAEISFNDDNYKEFLKALNSEINTEELTVLGTDGYLYSITFNGCKKLQEAGVSKKKIMKNQITFAKKCQSDIAYTQKIFNSYQADKIHKTGFGFIGYNKYVFPCRHYNRAVPFRFRKAKNANQPLVIYFGGGGTIGHNNFYSFFEHLTIGQTSKLLKADCNILVPQSIRNKSVSEEDARENYIESCTELINKLIDEFDVDKNRIYIYGASFGGGCVWNMLVNHSDMIAGAVELMGCYYGYKKFDEIDFERVAKVPIWLVHSSNDNVVNIDSDDSFYNELKKYNTDIKYTRPDKYGHKIAGRFLKQNKWVEWMLS